MKIGIAVLLMGACLTLSATYFPHCGEVYGGAEALYWKPTHCPIPFAMGSVNPETNTTLTDFTLEADYDWGVRSHVGYECCCFFGEASYLYLAAADRVLVDRGGLDTLMIQGGFSDMLNSPFASSVLRIHYQNFDLRFGGYLRRNCGYTLQMYGNARWVDIQMRNRTTGFFPGSVSGALCYQQNSSFEGGGVGVGIKARTYIWCGFDAGGRLGLAAIIGRSKLNKQQFVRPLETTALIPDGSTCLVPEAELQLSVAFNAQWGCFGLAAEVGYELNYYVGALRFSDQFEEIRLPLRSCFGVGFGGPYIGVAVNW